MALCVCIQNWYKDPPSLSLVGLFKYAIYVVLHRSWCLSPICWHFVNQPDRPDTKVRQQTGESWWSCTFWYILYHSPTGLSFREFSKNLISFLRPSSSFEEGWIKRPDQIAQLWCAGWLAGGYLSFLPSCFCDVSWVGRSMDDDFQKKIQLTPSLSMEYYWSINVSFWNLSKVILTELRYDEIQHRKSRWLTTA